MIDGKKGRKASPKTLRAPVKSTRDASLASKVWRAFGRALRPYQRAWMAVALGHAFIAQLGARQIGKDIFWAGFIVAQVLTSPGVEWQCYSSTGDKAQEFLDDCRRWLAYFKRALGPDAAKLPRLIVDNAGELALSNGARIVSRASTVRSTVGVRGNILLNEVGVIPHAELLFDAAYPVVDQARRNRIDAMMVVISNASRVGTWWHEFWTGKVAHGRGGWIGVITTWDSAMRAMQMPYDQLAQARRRIVETIGARGFDQWYGCAWRSASGGFFDPDVLDARSFDPTQVEGIGGWPQSLGYDIGRLRHPCAIAPVRHGPSAGWIMRTWAEWRVSYPEQRAEIARRVAERPTRRIVVDATGQDEQDEQLRRAHGSHVVVPYNFSSAGDACFHRLRDALEDGTARIDRGDLDLRMELEGIDTKADARGLERVRLHEARRRVGAETRTSHADRAVAAALGHWGYRANQVSNPYFDPGFRGIRGA